MDYGFFFVDATPKRRRRKDVLPIIVDRGSFVIKQHQFQDYLLEQKTMMKNIVVSVLKKML